MASLKFIEQGEGTNHWVPDPEHDDIKMIASNMWWYGPDFSPKDVPKFYDVSGITESPEAFQKVVDIFVNRYKGLPEEKKVTHIVGYDARGFLLGPPIALALRIPFVLLRKHQKNPGVVVSSRPYGKEYAEDTSETQCIRIGAIGKGSRVVLIDDLIATGGTAVSGFDLVEAMGAEVHEFAAMICLPFLDGVKKIRDAHDGKFKDVSVCTLVSDAHIPDSVCGHPQGWQEESRHIHCSSASDVYKKYPFPR